MELFKQIKLPRLPHRCASLQSISSSFFSFFHIFNGFPEWKIDINCFVFVSLKLVSSTGLFDNKKNRS